MSGIRFVYILLLGSLAFQASVPANDHDARSGFFQNLSSLCGYRFEGESTFPEDPGDAFRGKHLVAVIHSCSDTELRIPFSVGIDTSRTWVIRIVPDGLELKHDHLHADGSADEITNYGGTTVDSGSALSQSFPADEHTATLIPEASTNVWTLTLSEDGKTLIYNLDRHGEPRFRAVLKRRN